MATFDVRCLLPQRKKSAGGAHAPADRGAPTSMSATPFDLCLVDHRSQLLDSCNERLVNGRICPLLICMAVWEIDRRRFRGLANVWNVVPKQP